MQHRILIPLLVLLAISGAPAQQVHDLVIYGGTSAAMTAAVQAKKMGKTVVVVSPDRHLGGLTAGGLGWTDSGNKAVIGGLSREFYQRVKKHYDASEAWLHQKPEEYRLYRRDDDAMWAFEPHVAERTFERWIEEMEIPVVRDAWLDRDKGVSRRGQRIVSLTTLDGRTYAGRMFMDATYEGDLMAAAGVSYTTGREANSQYGETLNGVQTARARSHQFTNDVDPYVVPGDPSSGLLPRIHDNGPGEDGQADEKIQAYNFRLCMTNVPANRVAFEKPDGYDPRQYELLLRDLQAGSRHVFGKFDPVPNGKTDTNNHGSFSTDNIGMNWDYPEASYERRRAIIQEHERYQKGYYYFLINDPRVPEDVRTKMREWGLAKDEFRDNGHWPHQIYVREARRMVGDFVVTENHVRRTQETPDSIGMGSYNMDSHNVQRYVARDAGGKPYARNEGDIQVSPGGPYPIGYRAIVPKTGEVENLFVPVALSASHIAYGSIRMEPVFMILGQSAATAASMAIDEGVPVQKVDYEKLRQRLLADGQVLEYQRSTSLFDGTTFTGWEGNLKLFRIQDGAIVAGSLAEKIVRNEFLCTTKRYDDFELRLKVKLLGGDKANAGIQFRTARIPGHHEVVGYQADMGTGWWGALYDESRRNKVLKGPDQAKMTDVIKADDWNDYVVRAEGQRIRLSLNGVQTVDYTEEDPSIPASGLICVQIHSGPPSEAWYKDIVIASR